MKVFGGTENVFYVFTKNELKTRTETTKATSDQAETALGRSKTLNNTWNIDFAVVAVSNALSNSRYVQMLNVIDDSTREVLAACRLFNLFSKSNT